MKESRAFTLIELMVSMAIVTIILMVLLSITDQASKTWRYTNSKIEQFRSARTAFETMIRRVSQATLNTYWDYERNAAGDIQKYVRQSELRFIADRTTNLTTNTSHPRPLHGIFFQAPLGYVDDYNVAGLDNLLNTWGYFVEFNDDSAWKPTFLTKIQTRNRFRLMEFMQPANGLTIYDRTSGFDPSGKAKNLSYAGKDWFQDAFNPPATAPVHVLAENVIGLIVLPKLASQDDPSGKKLSPHYKYDSTATNADPKINPKNQLPPVVQVTLVALDEASAARLEAKNGTNMPGLGFNTSNTLFEDADKYESDLSLDRTDGVESLEETLLKNKLNYRIFTTNISIRGAKWSTE